MSAVEPINLSEIDRELGIMPSPVEEASVEGTPSERIRDEKGRFLAETSAEETPLEEAQAEQPLIHRRFKTHAELEKAT